MGRGLRIILSITFFGAPSWELGEEQAVKKE